MSKQDTKSRIFQLIELNVIRDLRTGNRYTISDFLSGGAGGLGEAPDDGQSYVRKNESWAVIPESEPKRRVEVKVIPEVTDYAQYEYHSILEGDDVTLSVDKTKLMFGSSWEGKTVKIMMYLEGVGSGNSFLMLNGSGIDACCPTTKVIDNEQSGMSCNTTTLNNVSQGVSLWGNGDVNLGVGAVYVNGNGRSRIYIEEM